MNVVAASVLMGLPVLPLHAQDPSPKSVNFYSLEREIQIGQDLAADLARTLPSIRESKLDAWLAGLTAELAKHADPRFTYSVTVYDDRKAVRRPGLSMAMPVDAFHGPVVEPVSLPGGPIAVPFSLLANAPDEAAVAFQLAHAMSHIALRHATRQATRMELQSVATYPLRVQSVSGVAADVILAAQPIAMELSLFTFARRFELEADALAAGILSEAGYDPAKVVPYLEDQWTTIDPRPAKIFTGHPTITRRIETIEGELDKRPTRVYGASTGQFAEIQALIAGMQ